MTPSRFDREAKAVWYLPDGRLAMLAAETPTDRCRLDGPTASAPLWVSRRRRRERRAAPRRRDVRRAERPPVARRHGGCCMSAGRTGEEGRLHVFDIATGEDRLVRDRQPGPDREHQQGLVLAGRQPDPVRPVRGRRRALGRRAECRGRRGEHRSAMGPPEGTGTEAQFTPDGPRCWPSMRRRPMAPASSGSWTSRARRRTGSSRRQRTMPRRSSAWRPSRGPSDERRPSGRRSLALAAVDGLGLVGERPGCCALRSKHGPDGQDLLQQPAVGVVVDRGGQRDGRGGQVQGGGADVGHGGLLEGFVVGFFCLPSIDVHEARDDGQTLHTGVGTVAATVQRVVPGSDRRRATRRSARDQTRRR